jgi:zinc/manganese transport system permease protein
VPVRPLSIVFLVLLGCAAAEASQITGALLVFSLLVMPAAAAQQVTVRPGPSFALTIVLGLVVVWLGLGVAYFSTYPVGFYITSFGFTAYLLAAAWRATTKRLARSRPGPALAG